MAAAPPSANALTAEQRGSGKAVGPGASPRAGRVGRRGSGEAGIPGAEDLAEREDEAAEAVVVFPVLVNLRALSAGEELLVYRARVSKKRAAPAAITVSKLAKLARQQDDKARGSTT